MSFGNAISRLASWSVSGVTLYDLDDLPGVIAEADLPAMIPELGGTGGETFQSLGITVNAGQFVVHINHHLLVSGLGVGLIQDRFHGALTHIENYLHTAAGDLFLNDNLLEPLAIADTYAGAFDWAGVIYYAVTFRHRWVLKVT